MLELSLNKILNKYGALFVEALKQSLSEADRVATGRTNDSITFEVIENTLTVSGRDAILTLEYGRPPTGEGRGLFSETGSFLYQIKEWVSARGLPEESAYPIYVKINREGFEGTEGVISEPVNKLLKELRTELDKEIEEQFRVQLTALWL